MTIYQTGASLPAPPEPDRNFTFSVVTCLRRIILTEKVEHLGAEADVVKVKRGYARNFLIPHGKALEVTPAADEAAESA